MDFNSLKKAIFDAAEKQNIKEFEIYYMSDSSMQVETLKDEISSFSSGVSGGLCFRCLFDGKMGYASTELLEEAEMTELVERAVENAKSTEKLDEAGIFAGSKEYGKTNAPEYKVLEAADLKSIALDIQKQNYAASEKVVDGTQSAAMTFGCNVRICNSHGLDLSNAAGVNAVYSVVVVRDGEESIDNFEVQEYGADFDAAALAKKSADGALESLGAGLVESGKYNVIIDGKQMRSILSAFSPAFSAKNAQLGLSLLTGKEGTAVASDIVTITDDAMRQGISFQTPFDAEGVATKKKNVIENGVLKTLLYNLETAKKAGCESTGNASKGGYSSPVGISPYAFCIEAGKYTRDELFGLAKDGIYVTEVKGLHAGANAVTGDFSIESAGFVIENGKKGRPIKSFTIAGNFFELLKSISALSNEVKTGVSMGFTVFGSPDVLIKGMSVAGK